jgi:hypothetical protein
MDDITRTMKMMARDDCATGGVLAHVGEGGPTTVGDNETRPTPTPWTHQQYQQYPCGHSTMTAAMTGTAAAVASDKYNKGSVSHNQDNQEGPENEGDRVTMMRDDDQ